MISAKELSEKVEQLKKFEEEKKKVEQEQKLKEELAYVEKCINEAQKTLKPTDTYIEIPSNISLEVQKELLNKGYWIDIRNENITRLYFEKNIQERMLGVELGNYNTINTPNDMTGKYKLINSNKDNKNKRSFTFDNSGLVITDLNSLKKQYESTNDNSEKKESLKVNDKEVKLEQLKEKNQDLIDELFKNIFGYYL